MARKLTLTLLTTSALLSSCAAIKPLNSTGSNNQPVSLPVVTSEVPQANFHSESKVVEELADITIHTDEELETQDLATIVKEEQEIIKKYEREDLKKEDPVNSVADSEPPFQLDYKQKHYDFWMNYFTKRDVARFKRHVTNGMKYKSIVEKVFEEEGLPKDLFFVGLIESGFNTHIKSHASAVGPWQFIKGTATRYTLRVDNEIDERRSIYKATYAAAQYFKDLYNIFGSWELALCAYNAGEYRIINAIRKGNTRDYKSLVSKKLLPKETIFYIPKIAAAKELFKTVSQGIVEKEAEFFQKVEEIEVSKPISLKQIAKQSKISKEVLKKLNPDIRWDYVSKKRKGFKFYVPESKHERTAQVVDSLKAKAKVIERRIAMTSDVHKVSRGESLYRIARRYDTTIGRIKRMNNLRRNKIFVGQKLKVPTKTGKVYVVQRGDNLTAIARKFGLSVNTIVKTNGLTEKTIYPKQKIILPI